MKIAFCLFKYFPYGGLQRDFKRIAEVCYGRGHSVNVFTTSWEGSVPDWFDVSIIPVRGFTNHRRRLNFSKKALEATKDGFDVVVGFNKIHGLDVYYAADPCYKAIVMEERGLFYRLSSRCRTYLALEEDIFKPSAKTEVLLISEKGKGKFVRYYGTPEQRLHVLPPSISEDRLAPSNAGEIRKDLRKEFGVGEDELLLLMVGSGFKTKGVDRSICALASLPEELKEKTRLFVIGRGNEGRFKRMAKRYGIGRHVRFLGGRNDVSRFMLGADILLHPSRSENTGMALIEAMASGIPILASDVCGYAHHVEKGKAGLLIPLPFRQEKFNELLLRMLTSRERKIWAQNGIDYVSRIDVLNMPDMAADIIETVARKNRKP